MSEERQILVNCAMCKNCKEVLVSTHRHDFRSCKCMQESQKRIDELDDHAKTFEPEFYNTLHGISVDGGTDYLSRSWYHPSDLEELSVYVDNN